MEPTQRFSSRVENYLKYRPGYPAAMVQCLKDAGALTAETVAADVGSGTGFLAELFLKEGNLVFGVEPNREMREAGERYLQAYPQFQSIDGTAEATTLADASVDLITAGQAFHWFDRAKTQVEFARILKPGGWVALIWNDRRTSSSAFLVEYERLLRDYATDYTAVEHKQITDDVIGSFFGPGGFVLRSFENRQEFDWEGLRGRLLSSSYAPETGHPNHEPMLRRLREIFEMNQQEGRVAFEYDTKLYYGHLF